MNTSDRSGERQAIVTPFPGTFDPSAEIEDEKPESPAELASRAENIAIYALTRRAVSVREMQKLLTSRDLPDDIVANEIARLEGVGLLDDDALAIDLAERFQRRKGLGSGAIKHELAKRLLSPSSIDAALSELPGDQVELATAEARKRLSRLGGLDRDTAYRRLHAYLARRGFRGSEITTALATAMSEKPDNVVRVHFVDA